MRLGVDRLLDDTHAGARWRGKRLGMVTNDLALTSDLTRGREALVEAGWRFDVLFGPEHGLSGRAREGEHVGDIADAATGVPVRSLYGEHVRPAAEDVAPLDALLIDLPDVGSRFYTYIWTMSHVLEACADAGTPVVVLDRPNPIGGDVGRAEGPVLDESIASLVGRWPLPIRHGLTIGELARHWVRTRAIDLELDVVELQGWSRHETAIGRSDLTWMPPSPNIPTAATALLYPGTCLVEGVNVAEGRSTAVPFRVLAAPFIDGERYAARVNEERLPGVRAVPYGFTPLVRDHAGVPCEGVILHVTDAEVLRPVRTGVRLLSLLAEMHPGLLEERPGVPVPGESDASPLEKLFGVRGAFAQIVSGEWDDPARLAVPDWLDAAEPDLLYR
ncbi:DUF1343 domain-containing protein [Microbacterium betulae]|uniref:DUF1343 domain-containing protein n=1 Tax=Microbacterium betulae TaxID=2981139 RepID=A0AA97I498_9MICO|nr:DUF1343 domain-containing protein [Microbacterium sp. AB]WOF22381.1 DUF1343 domain-containing protein [Microbacterium sp. AB]